MVGIMSKIGHLYLAIKYNFARLSVVAALFIVVSDGFAMQGGEPATAAQSQGIVGLSFTENFQNCVGLLLESDKVLTTANCLEFIGERVTASEIRVHPLLSSEIGGGLFPTLDETVEPFVGVQSIVVHPSNPGGFGPFNIAILSLTTDLAVSTATIYGGSQSFVGNAAAAFGWEQFTRSDGFIDRRFFRANVLAMPAIIDGDDDFDSIDTGCYDSFEDTDTVLCAGYKNNSQFLESSDKGAPLIVNVNDTDVAIGVLISASNGFAADGGFRYEEFARLSTMKNFIVENAPNTRFFDGSAPVPETPPRPEVNDIVIVPIIDLLLSD